MGIQIGVRGDIFLVRFKYYDHTEEKGLNQLKCKLSPIQVHGRYSYSNSDKPSHNILRSKNTAKPYSEAKCPVTRIFNKYISYMVM